MPNCLSCKAIVPSGTTVCRSCSAPVPESAAATKELEQAVRSLLEQGRNLEAAKLYMDQTGSSLKESKDAVEGLQDDAGPPRPTEADADLEANLVRLLKDGEKIKAVKLYRDRTGASLADSKRAVEAIATHHGIKVQTAGCGSVAIVVAVASAVVCVAAVLMV